MTTTSNLSLHLRLLFERAGVEFNIEVTEPPSSDSGPSFSLVALDASTGDALRFQSSVSPVLADWVRGYTRWLFRARVRAEYADDAIIGSFPVDATAEQVLEGLQLACDMIRQRFDLYEESILA